MKKRGKGLAVAFYPTGMGGGGDFSHAVVKIKPDGTADLIVGTVDLGEGSRTVLPQLAAEILGIPYEHVRLSNSDTDACPICFGTFASRVTYFTGNAVVEAATNAKQMVLDEAATLLNTVPDRLEISDGIIRDRDEAEKSIPLSEVAFTALYVKHKFLIGNGCFGRPSSRPDPETGACDPLATVAWAATYVEVEVDTETGVVEIVDSKSVYDVGKAINPALVNGQIIGGAAMGTSWTLLEALYPNYPSSEHEARSFRDYAIATTMDVPNLESRIVECPSTGGPFGAKGMGEMTANPPAPAIVNAVHDAVGVWITDLPLTPERVLRALETQGV
ncbi:MAG: molybdopterin cofactor-binding domain-containing protein [Thermodesulfobacteriota bacterium]